MIAVTVQRAPADRPGQDITDPLLTADLAARERGRIEIDRASTNRVMVSLTGPYRQWIAPGSLLAVAGRRGPWRGLVRRCGLTLSREGDSFQADLALEVEREL